MRFLPLLFLGLVVGLTLRFNWYKVPWIYYLEGPYKIFPWSYPGQISLSPRWWLMIHPVMAMALQILTVLQLGCQSSNGTQRWLEQIHQILHYLFSGFVLMNIHHFGQAPPLVAILLQGILLMIMQLRKKGWIYFLVLSSAPLLEVGLYIWERIL